MIKTVNEKQIGILRLHIPDFAILYVKSLLLAVFAAVLIFYFKLSMLKVIGIMIFLGFGSILFNQVFANSI